MSVTDIQPEETGAVAANPPTAKSNRALSALKRELTDKELASTGAQKLLLEDLERLKDDNHELSVFREKFHATDKALAILKEKQKRNISAEIISGSCLAIGAAALSYAPSLWASQPSGWILLGFGVVLTLGGVLAKVQTL
ncbi:hypothetical protein [Aquipseudomonas alcaligenes]|uniref:hypothetical protein n=1 Tax=Aquipseudomonas alcaligenes TaxID=43263 RepID=UPI0012E89B22|nr:hypothetical protein [Pseudomonas alcaligenes]